MGSFGNFEQSSRLTAAYPYAMPIGNIMAKRTTKAESMLITLALIIGGPICITLKLVEITGWIIPVVAIIIITFILIGWCKYDEIDKKKNRFAYLREKYNDEDVAQKIYDGCFWQGQTEEQLNDALGAPLAIDRKVLKTKTKEIWKYNSQGANRYGLRITVENGCVVGWDKKA